jgi:carbamoyl-phosphate synthase large subunit
LIGRENEVDAICDGENILIPGIMEHLERAGVHSGDSISIYPPQNICDKIKEKILVETEKVARALKVIGMINIQYIEYEGDLYIIEVNPRSSRTVPYISKVTGVPMIELATRVMLGEKLVDLDFGTGIYKEANNVAIKVPVFSTQKLPDVEVSLGPEMRSTGEVLGVGKTFEEALYKGFIGSGMGLVKEYGTILATIKPYDQEEFIPIAKKFTDIGYRFVATEGTANVLKEAGINVQKVKKISEGVPNILDLIRSGLIDMVINTPTKANDVTRDGFRIRRAAIESSVPVLTSLDTARGMLDIIGADMNPEKIDVYNLGQ